MLLEPAYSDNAFFKCRDRLKLLQNRSFEGQSKLPVQSKFYLRMLTAASVLNFIRQIGLPAWLIFFPSFQKYQPILACNMETEESDDETIDRASLDRRRAI